MIHRTLPPERDEIC